MALNAQASKLSNEGRPAQALAAAKECLAIYGEVLGEDHAAYAGTLINAALLAEKAALPLGERAVRLAREASGERHPEHARALSILGTIRE
ncbi:MAG: tetratricopeptide repeat protein [Gemmataceae bacterium]|nr:tetratricopeptide repeat protein [Gemmataceae bacterium]